MGKSDSYLKSADAARRLGVSAKALRLYEQRGLVAPGRTAAGWRSYGPLEMRQASEVIVLRAFGLSLTEIARVLKGDARDLASAMAIHHSLLEQRIGDLATAIAKVGAVREKLARGEAPDLAAMTTLLTGSGSAGIGFDLPWPWDGERFELRDARRISFIIGPLGSGKTRLARKLAEMIAGAVFVDLDRLADGGAVSLRRLDVEPALKARVEQALGWLVEDGATRSPALVSLLVGLYGTAATTVVVDMVEQGLDQASQEAVIAYLRRGNSGLPPLFLMTRSCAILDLAAVRPDEAIILCPANHSPPTLVAPYAGAPGYEAVASCLATPAVRARSAG